MSSRTINSAFAGLLSPSLSHVYAVNPVFVESICKLEDKKTEAANAQIDLSLFLSPSLSFP
jgi:hypothetical protein